MSTHAAFVIAQMMILMVLLLVATKTMEEIFANRGRRDALTVLLQCGFLIVHRRRGPRIWASPKVLLRWLSCDCGTRHGVGM